MGRRQTETYYPTEVSYPKSVLLWLQEYWTGPAVHIHPLRVGFETHACLAMRRESSMTEAA